MSCRRLLTLSVLHDCFNKKNHLCMLILSHKVTKGVILLKWAKTLKSLESCIFVNSIRFLKNSEVVVACFLVVGHMYIYNYIYIYIYIFILWKP